MGTFLNDVGMVPIPAYPDLYYLDGPLIYQDGNVKITAPQGMITDDASIPKILDWIPFLDRQGLSRRPGIIHDALYSLGRDKGKCFADMTLREMCLAEGMTKFEAEVIFLAVDLFGGKAWDKDRGNGEYQEIPKLGDFYTMAGYADWCMKAGKSIFS